MSQVAQDMVGNFANTGRESIWQRLTRLNLYAITLLSLGMFDPRFYGSSAEELGPTQVDQSPSLQQYLLLGFWITIIACTFAPKVLRRPLSTRGLLWPILFLFYMAASVLWADDPLDAATKAMVFVITSVGVWRLTSVFTLTDFFAVLTRSLYGLMIASAALIIRPR